LPPEKKLQNIWGAILCKWGTWRLAERGWTEKGSGAINLLAKNSKGETSGGGHKIE